MDLNTKYFLEWKETQIKLGNITITKRSDSHCFPFSSTKGFGRKYTRKVNNAKYIHGLVVELSFEEYLYKCFAANINEPEMIGTSPEQYHLGRIGDIGNYTNENCRFIEHRQNNKERTLNGGSTKQAERLTGRKRPDHSSKMKGKMIGADNPQFKGHYVTPNGVFVTRLEAATANNCTIVAIQTRCRNSHKVVSRVSKHFDKECVGKSFSELGWGFIEKRIKHEH